MNESPGTDNIQLNLARIGKAKHLVLPYFGHDGKKMYNTKSNIDMKDPEKIRL